MSLLYEISKSPHWMYLVQHLHLGPWLRWSFLNSAWGPQHFQLCSTLIFPCISAKCHTSSMMYTKQACKLLHMPFCPQEKVHHKNAITRSMAVATCWRPAWPALAKSILSLHKSHFNFLIKAPVLAKPSLLLRRYPSQKTPWELLSCRDPTGLPLAWYCAGWAASSPHRKLPVLLECQRPIASRQPAGVCQPRVWAPVGVSKQQLAGRELQDLAGACCLCSFLGVQGCAVLS